MTTARIIVPGKVLQGEPFQIKALINHPMETGFRKDAVGEAIARDIVTSFTCHYDGDIVFAWDVFTGTAANPYISFWTTATRTGDIVLTWRGMNSFTHVERRRIMVT